MACEKTNASALHEQLYGSQLGGIFGYSYFTGGYADGHAEYVRVPPANNKLLKIPNSLPNDKGIYLSYVLHTSYHSVVYSRVKEGDNAAIWGLGPISLMASAWTYVRGDKQVIGIDSNWRCAYAESKIPGLKTINFRHLKATGTVPAKVHEILPGGANMIDEAIMSTQKFGAVGLIGGYVGFTKHFNVGSLMERGIRLVGCDWDEILEMVEKEKIDPTIMLTHRFKFDDITKAYHKQEKREMGLVKCFVETKFSTPAAAGTPALTTI
ncbi:hypothetical protein ACHAQF_008379 [Verticillium nonalfalfae]